MTFIPTPSTCGICGEPGAARRPGYDFEICERCAVPQGAPELLTDAGGALSWDFRPPSAVRTAHHDEPIRINGRVMYQQAPPVHPRSGARYRTPMVRLVRAMTEAEAERRANELERTLDARGCTPAEMEVLRLQAEGLSRDEIAERLGIGVESVKDRLKRARKRLEERRG